MTGEPGRRWTDLAGAEERTHQAWRRTVLSTLVVVLVAVSKLVVTAPSQRVIVIVAVMVLGWFAILAIAQRRMTALRTQRRVLINRSPALVALVVATIAVLAAVLFH